jgi:hypothetical protein
MAIAGWSAPADDQIVSVAPGDHAGSEWVQEWLGAYAVSRDPILRERIVLAYLGLADRLAKRFRCSRGTTLENLTQTARAALVAAVDRYDPSRQQSFVPFAVACVVGELKRCLRDATWRLDVPRQLKERSLNLSKALEELPQRLGRSPTIAELAVHLAVTEEEVAHTRIACSLDEPLGRPTTVRWPTWWPRPSRSNNSRTCCSSPSCWPTCPRPNGKSSCFGSSPT